MSLEQENAGQVERPAKSKLFSVKGIIGVFSDPESFFKELKDNPKVLVPYLVYLSAIIAFAILSSDLFMAMILEQEDVIKQIEDGVLTTGILRKMNLFMVPIIVGIIPLVAAGFGMFWGNFVFAGNAKFKQVLSIMIYGALIYVLGFLLRLPLMMASDSFLSTYSLAAFLPDPSMNSPMFTILSKFDVFIIWEIVVIGTGLSILYNIPRNKGYLLSVLSMGMMPIMDITIAAFKAMFF